MKKIQDEEEKPTDSQVSPENIATMRSMFSNVALVPGLDRRYSFLLSVAAINHYPQSGDVTAASYPDHQQAAYEEKYIIKDFPFLWSQFDLLSKPTVVIDEKTKRRKRSIQDHFIPMHFWDWLIRKSGAR